MQNVRLNKVSSHNHPHPSYFSPAPHGEVGDGSTRLKRVNNYVSQGTTEYDSNSMSSSMFYGSAPTGKFLYFLTCTLSFD